MNTTEVWLAIKGYEGRYEISNFGRVRSLEHKVLVHQARYKQPRLMVWAGRLLRPGVGARGYPCVVLSNDSQRRNYRVHRLVAEHFILNPENKPTVNHINANKLDNRVANLEWATFLENNMHAIDAGLRPTKNKQYIRSK